MYIQRPAISPQEVARRREHAIRANVEIAEVRLPQLRLEIARHQAVIEQFACSRGISAVDSSVLREQLAARQAAIREAQEEKRLAQQRISRAKQEIDRLTEVDKQTQGTIRCMLFGYSPSADTLKRIAQQQQVIQEAEEVHQTDCAAAAELSEDEMAFVIAYDTVIAMQNSMRHHESAKKKLLRMEEAGRKAMEAERRKKQKEGLRDAIVAAFLEKTRDLANDLRKQLLAQAVRCPHCPYCGGDYGHEPHADHIYPVSRGGLSIIENMVLVCNRCNLKKADRTLREFILQVGTDRSLVETNLQRLGKVF
jgi:5-methylcytosine-specific restriction endonuclease McrA